jgi:hypothetical protein
MPANMQSSLIFHYNLKFFENDADHFEGVSLKRFVMQVRAFKNAMFFFSFKSAVTYRCLPFTIDCQKILRCQIFSSN